VEGNAGLELDVLSWEEVAGGSPGANCAKEPIQNPIERRVSTR